MTRKQEETNAKLTSETLLAHNARSESNRLLTQYTKPTTESDGMDNEIELLEKEKEEWR
jgi:hypothetical protein